MTLSCVFISFHQNVDGVNYFHVKVVGLLFVATTRTNVSPSLVLELLQRIARVIKDYLGVLNEDSFRKNFVLVYELLDEVVVSILSWCALLLDVLSSEHHKWEGVLAKLIILYKSQKHKQMSFTVLLVLLYLLNSIWWRFLFILSKIIRFSSWL